MRLRYLHLQDLPPLQDVDIAFGHESLLGRALAIRFVVGVNGTGKTRLLQALTETFLALSRQDLPPFPITLAYDLGVGNDQRTIYLHYSKGSPKSKAVLVEFADILTDVSDWADLADINWAAESEVFPYPVRNRFHGNALPGTGAIDAFLPAPLLVYTSGDTASWHALFAPQVAGLEDLLTERSVEEESAFERPAEWDATKERAHLVQSGQVEQAQQVKIPSLGELEMVFQQPRTAIFITSEQLKLAACSVALYQAIQEWSETTRTSRGREALRGLLGEVGWESPLSITLHINFQPDSLDKDRSQKLHDLYQIAASVAREPEPSSIRHLSFDLRRPVLKELKLYTLEAGTPPLTIEALFEILGGENPTPFEVFYTLHTWQQSGLLCDVDLVLRRQELDDVLLYDWLSDGERMFLGRIALFYLPQEQDDALLILDEPDTHFNDVWKRRLVDILDSALGHRASDVIISTHSSIALTDVFDTEITLLRQVEGTIAVVETPIPTFGTLPSEIMQSVFETPSSIGQRAREFLGLVLLLVQYPDTIERIWGTIDPDLQQRILRTSISALSDEFAEDPGALLGDVQPFEELVTQVQSQQSEIPSLNRGQAYLLKVLLALRDYTQRSTGKTAVTVAETLDVLGERVGPSYYQFEIRRRMRALRGRGTDAAQD